MELNDNKRSGGREAREAKKERVKGEGGGIRIKIKERLA